MHGSRNRRSRKHLAYKPYPRVVQVKTDGSVPVGIDGLTRSDLYLI